MKVSKRSKVVSLQEAAALIHDGDTVALQGMGTQLTPMALVRELIRRQVKDLEIVCVVGGIGLDMLVAAGCVRKVTAPIVNMAMYGLAKTYRRAAEAGQIEAEEYSESSLLARLYAGSRGLPFGLTRGALGTDIPGLHPGTTRVIDDPFGSGQQVLACKALVPDVAIIHVTRADQYGNCQMEPRAIWPDIEIFPRASRRCIVTAESIVSDAVTRQHPEKTNVPFFVVDAVAEAPYGAHPCSLFPLYYYDKVMYEEYVEASSSPEGTRAFLDRYVYGVASHEEYLERVLTAKVRGRIRYEEAWA